MKDKKSLTILGGGPAGLAVGYYAKKNGVDFMLFEAADRIGGNAITLRHGDFLFDSGAHRVHDKDAEVTADLKNLMGDDLARIDVPSRIYCKGKFVDFPLSPLDLLRKLGPFTFIKAGFELLMTKIRNEGGNEGGNENFEAFALKTYGKTMSHLFLLNYSEKLWGLPCNMLSAAVSGKRMKGLNLKTFLKEAFVGKKAKTEHLDGAFYYPRMGIGSIMEKLAEFCGEEKVCKRSGVTRIFHEKSKISAIEINGADRVSVDHVVSSLALSDLMKLMSPRPSKEILSLAAGLRFRNMIIVTVFVGLESITDDGSIYFPEPRFPFTRVYEPRNRSRYMSPSGKTSLCAEIPCFDKDELWEKDEKKLVAEICSHFIELGWMKQSDIIGTEVTRLKLAYPVLEAGSEEKIRTIFSYLNGFSNLKLTGRSGRFLYTHIHDMMRFGREVISQHVSDCGDSGG